MHSNVELPSLPSLSSREFEKFRGLAYNTFGLDLKSGKEQLVSARLGKLLSKHKIHSFDRYYDYVVGDNTGRALVEMIDALTTNHTSFFREKSHFDFLSSLSVAESASGDPIRIWCAAASTGEEPYSIAICLLEAFAGRNRRFEILATDISSKALAMAQSATYPANRVDTVPELWLRKYFLRGQRGCEGMYRLKPQVRKSVDFRRLNLIEPLPSMGLFSVIFCRNVMIYFDKLTQTRVVNQLAACLEPDGYLFIGHAESLSGIEHSLVFVQPAVYRRSPLPHNSVKSRRRTL